MLYVQNKAYIIPVGVILISIFVFLFLVSRQIQDVSLTSSQIQEAQKRIAILKENIRILSQTDDKNQSSMLENVSRALPIEKDFSGILSAIALVSSRTGISVADYSFQVGDISKPTIVNTPAPLTLSLILAADAYGAARFLRELSRTVPLSSVESVWSSGNQSTVSVAFYFRPLSSAKVDLHTPIQNQSLENNDVLQTISSWQILESTASGSLF